MTAESSTSRLVGKLIYRPKPDCLPGATLQHVHGAVNLPDPVMAGRKLKPHAAVKFYVERFR
jgi:hypothetical protein